MKAGFFPSTGGQATGIEIFGIEKLINNC